jgi:flagellin
MSRINTNVLSQIGQRILSQQNQGLNKSLERLSTGLAINRGADDPAGLIASENLRSEKAAISAAIGNAERAEQVINIAEGGLQEVSSLLIELQGLVQDTANDAGLSTSEKEANQLQVDSIIQTIDRIASSTSFQGAKLLNGNYDFTVSSQASTVSSYDINAAKLGHGETQAVSVVVTASAQHGALFLSTGGALDLTSDTSKFTFELAGAKGSREFAFASGTSLANIVTTINTFKDVTGVSAITQGTGIMLKSTEFGSDAHVQVDVIDDAGQAGAIHNVSAIDEDVVKTAGGTAYSAVTNPIRDAGQDVSAIINGVAATSKGKVASVNTDFLDLSIELTTAGAQAQATIAAFTITGGGAKFNLGPSVNINNQVSVGIGNFAARNIGDGNVGFLDDLGSGKTNNVVDGNLEDAQKIIDAAISRVSNARGRLGAFQKNVIGTTIRSLGVSFENTSAAESSIRDTDFAAETANLTRSQILVQAATNVLAISNSQPQQALALLG